MRVSAKMLPGIGYLSSRLSYLLSSYHR